MSKISTPLMLRELAREELPALFPLINLHNPSVSQSIFDQRLAEMVGYGYRAMAAFEGEEMIGCCGFWVRTRFWCGHEFDIDNFVVHPHRRSQKIGEQMLQWLEAKAQEEKCELIVLDAYADSFRAHRFYLKNGYSLTGYHITKIPGTNDPFTKKRD